MIVWSVIAVVVLVLVLSIIIVIMQRNRLQKGIVVSSNYLKIIITGIVTVLISIGGMVALYFSQIPFPIGLPLLGMGIVYLVAGFIYRNEWVKLTRMYLRRRMR